ncbi:hypothetical protein [Thiocapsa sp. N5-Cardenillas]|uniref:hypothetical protein n=1 Tax=Thiocapsa sp. N5-Cardenillas TaxID=3137397 RepID=UPI0035B0F29B
MSEVQELQMPCIHMNGTSPDNLIEDWIQARAAVEAAMDAVARCGPNMRDYYPLESGSWERALHQHEARWKQLHAISEELLSMAMKVQAIKDERSRNLREKAGQA